MLTATSSAKHRREARFRPGGSCRMPVLTAELFLGSNAQPDCASKDQLHAQCLAPSNAFPTYRAEMGFSWNLKGSGANPYQSLLAPRRHQLCFIQHQLQTRLQQWASDLITSWQIPHMQSHARRKMCGTIMLSVCLSNKGSNTHYASKPVLLKKKYWQSDPVRSWVSIHECFSRTKWRKHVRGLIATETINSEHSQILRKLEYGLRFYDSGSLFQPPTQNE